MTVSCTEDCSLLLEPELRFPGFTTSGEVEGARYQEEVDLAAGETTSIVWAFKRVDSEDMASTLAITVQDRSGQADPGKVVFDLGEPSKMDVTPATHQTTTAGP